jgi:hypothetical protein
LSDSPAMSDATLSAAQRWCQVLSRFDASELSVAAFCRENAIAGSSFFYWRRRLANRPAAPDFVEAKVVAVPVAARAAVVIEVRLRGGRRIRVRRGFDRALLAEIVTTLEGLPATSKGVS